MSSLYETKQFAFDWVQHPDRLRTPMVRGEDGCSCRY